MGSEHQKRVRLADIAEKCGVSINTVSHALHGKSDISQTVKERICKVAAEMGYIQNTSASFLRMGKSKSISIIIGDISNPHFAILIRDIEDTARKNGYTAFVINTDEDEQNEYDAIVSSISKNVDGIILCPAQKTTKNVEFLLRSGVPFTLVGRYFAETDTNYVISDDVGSGRLAAEYILNYSEKNAIIMAESYISSSHDRLAGIRDIYDRRGIRLHAEDIYVVDACGKNADALKTVSEKQYAGAICFSDLLALELLSKDEHIRIVSFDNIASRFSMPFRFASVSSVRESMGTRAVEVLMNAINGETATQHLVLPTALSEQSVNQL